jgi:multiple sugar transport system substrate-binding protein
MVGACGSSAATPTPPPAATPAATISGSGVVPTVAPTGTPTLAPPATITVADYASGGLNDQFAAEQQDYKTMFPQQQLSVNHAGMPWPDYYATINTDIIGGRAPEMMLMHPSYKDDYIKAGRLVDLKPIIEKDWPSFNLADFPDGMLSLYSTPAGCSWLAGAATPCEHLYGLPAYGGPFVVYYNVDAFKKAGIETPNQMVADGTWTWDNVRTVARTLVAKGGVRYGLSEAFMQVFTSTGWQVLPSLWEAYGGAPLSADGKTCMFTSPETIQATQLYWDMTFTDKTIPAPGSTFSVSSWSAGQAGMFWSNLQNAFPKVNFQLGVAPMPGGPKQTPAYTHSEVAAWVVLKDSPHPDLGAQFAIFMSTQAQAMKYTKVMTQPRTSVLTSPAYVSGATAPNGLTPEQWKDVVIPLETNPQVSVATYGFPNFTAILNSSLPIFQTVWKPDASIPSIMAKVCNVVQPLLPK